MMEVETGKNWLKWEADAATLWREKRGPFTYTAFFFKLLLLNITVIVNLHFLSLSLSSNWPSPSHLGEVWEAL